MQTFRQETQIKYPSFAADSAPSHLSFDLKAPKPISPLKLAEAFAPIPIRHHYHHGDDTDPQQHNPQGLPTQSMFPANTNPTYNTNPQSLTPAPTPPPPPSPKPKKQQYQTDQSRPFLFPFSRSQVRSARGSQLVPYAIDEADRLYNKHLHVSLSLLQMWQTREQCMIEESGLQKVTGSELNFETFDSVLSLNSHGRETGASFAGIDKSGSSRGEEPPEELPDVTLLDTKLKEVEKDIAQLGGRKVHQVDAKKLRRLREKREDILRIKRVELIYVSLFIFLSSMTISCLKEHCRQQYCRTYLDWFSCC